MQFLFVSLSKLAIKELCIYIYYIICLFFDSKISPAYAWKIPRMFHQQIMKEFFELWGWKGKFGGPSSQEYVGKIIDW